MAKVGEVFLDANDKFPELALETISGDTLASERFQRRVCCFYVV